MRIVLGIAKNVSTLGIFKNVLGFNSGLFRIFVSFQFERNISFTDVTQIIIKKPYPISRGRR